MISRITSILTLLVFVFAGFSLVAGEVKTKKSFIKTKGGKYLVTKDGKPVTLAKKK